MSPLDPAKSLDRQLLMVCLARELGELTDEQLRKELDSYFGAGARHGQLLDHFVRTGLLTRESIEALEEIADSCGYEQWIDRYRVESMVGTGAISVVFRARHVQMDRNVAIKVLLPRLRDRSSFAERFRREAKVCGTVNHPNLVRAYDGGQAWGFPYLVMEFVDGEPLEERLRRGGRLTQAAAIEILGKLAAALDHAHQFGLVHRDVKPANILLGKTGEVKLVDLGLAKPETGGPEITRVGYSVGTPQYMSPEQARGRDVDIRSDLYSLGIVLYRMVTGELPFDGPAPMDVMHRQIHESLPDPRELVPDLVDVVVTSLEKMCAKEREQRYEQPADLLKDLEPLIAPRPRGGSVTRRVGQELVESQRAEREARTASGRIPPRTPEATPEPGRTARTASGRIPPRAARTASGRIPPREARSSSVRRPPSPRHTPPGGLQTFTEYRVVRVMSDRELLLCQTALRELKVDRDQLARVIDLFEEMDEPIEVLLVRLGYMTEPECISTELRGRRDERTDQDRGFGQLAVQMGHASTDDVTRCLEHQEALRAGGKAMRPLGDLMVALDVLTPKAVAEINAEERAARDLGDGHRFGELVVAHTEVSDARMDQLLALQRRLVKAGKQVRVGQLMVELGVLTPVLRDVILRAQQRHRLVGDDVGELIAGQQLRPGDETGEVEAFAGLSFSFDGAGLKKDTTDVCPFCGFDRLRGRAVCPRCGKTLTDV